MNLACFAKQLQTQNCILRFRKSIFKIVKVPTNLLLLVPGPVREMVAYATHHATHHGTLAMCQRTREGWWTFPHYSKSGHPITAQVATIEEFPSVAFYHSLGRCYTIMSRWSTVEVDQNHCESSGCVKMIENSYWGNIYQQVMIINDP